MQESPLSVVRACLKAYVDKDRQALEALVAGEYHFTSPIDNALDRDSYFRLCWPNSKAIAGFEMIHQSERYDTAFIVYEGRTTSGKTFRNCEVHVVRDGRLLNTEVYFGWDVPHRLAQNTHENP
jgi:hypothetical protein